MDILTSNAIYGVDLMRIMSRLYPKRLYVNIFG